MKCASLRGIAPHSFFAQRGMASRAVTMIGPVDREIASVCVEVDGATCLSGLLPDRGPALAQRVQGHANVVGSFLIGGLFDFLKRPSQILLSGFDVSIAANGHCRPVVSSSVLFVSPSATHGANALVAVPYFYGLK